MITERLFMKSDIDLEESSSCKGCEFSIIEENAVYYAAGYVVQKLLKKFRKSVTMIYVFMQEFFYTW